MLKISDTINAILTYKTWKNIQELGYQLLHLMLYK